MPIEPSTTLQVQQRSAAKSLKFEQFPTSSTSSNAENDRTVGESYDILSGSTWLSAQETPSTSEDLFISLPPSLHLTSTPIAKTGCRISCSLRKTFGVKVLERPCCMLGAMCF